MTPKKLVCPPLSKAYGFFADSRDQRVHLHPLHHFRTHNDCYHVLVVRGYLVPREFWYFARFVVVIVAATVVIVAAVVVVVVAVVVESLVRLAKVRMVGCEAEWKDSEKSHRQNTGCCLDAV
ncbi:hypothetical protein Tco_0191628 [Tanacetum coccineum]